MNKTLKRYLYLIHRWFGIAMCLLIALWFASFCLIGGVVREHGDDIGLADAWTPTRNRRLANFEMPRHAGAGGMQRFKQPLSRRTQARRERSHERQPSEVQSSDYAVGQSQRTRKRRADSAPRAELSGIAPNLRSYK